MNILQEIAEKTRERIAFEKTRLPQRALIEKIRLREAEGLDRNGSRSGSDFLRDFSRADPRKPSFSQALQKEGMSFICEVKKASPSKGLIAPDFPYLEIALEYEAAGAAAISCLTEPYYFQGADRYLEEIAASVSIPVLRKDFTVDEYMVYQAKALGASAILLICAILDDAQLESFYQLARSLGMDVLVEAHDAHELERALDVGAEIIGEQPRSADISGGYGQQHPAAPDGAAGGDFCVGERHPHGGGYTNFI